MFKGNFHNYFFTIQFQKRKKIKTQITLKLLYYIFFFFVSYITPQQQLIY
jgi:hypothetical protein